MPGASPTPAVDWAAPQRTSGLWLATDGVRIERTADHGCTWATTFDVNSVLAPVSVDVGTASSSSSSAYQIVGLVSPPYPGDPSRVYAVLMPDTAVQFASLGFAPLPTLVAQSRDAGAHWQIQGGLLDPADASSLDWPRCYSLNGFDVHVAPSDPDVLYLHCAPDNLTPTLSPGNLFKSTDGGASWTRIDTYLPNLASDLAVDPRKPATIWLASVTNPAAGQFQLDVQQSRDSGAHWTSQTVERNLSDANEVGLDVTAWGETDRVLAPGPAALEWSNPSRAAPPRGKRSARPGSAVRRRPWRPSIPRGPATFSSHSCRTAPGTAYPPRTARPQSCSLALTARADPPSHCPRPRRPTADG
jgi:hypothetical protein